MSFQYVTSRKAFDDFLLLYDCKNPISDFHDNR